MKTDLEIAEEALAKWPTTTMGIMRTGIRDDLMLPAIADARAAGYAEAKADAVKELRTLPRTVIRFVHGPIEAIDLERAVNLVRALAPATTKEPK